MTDTWFELPFGRPLEQADYDPHRVGSVGPLRPADEGRLRLARKHLRELDEQDVEGDGKHLLDKTAGTEWEVVTSFVDLVDPKASGVEAFCVRDGLLVLLRSPEWKHPADESHVAGEIGGRQATPRDRLPLSERVY